MIHNSVLLPRSVRPLASGISVIIGFRRSKRLAIYSFVRQGVSGPHSITTFSYVKMVDKKQFSAYKARHICFSVVGETRRLFHYFKHSFPRQRWRRSPFQNFCIYHLPDSFRHHPSRMVHPDAIVGEERTIDGAWCTKPWALTRRI